MLLLKSILSRAMSSNSTPTKMTKLTKLIGTHDNTFHCDDVTACFMLKQLDRFKDHEIIRTRDSEKLAEAEIIVDVGSEFNVEKLRLDHHQRTFQLTIKDFHPNIKTTNPSKPPRLSSSGLVYSIFGKDLIMKLLDIKPTSYDQLDADKDSETKNMIDAIFNKAYIEFFEEIDAIDNGVEIACGDNLVYNYHISSGLSSRVGRLNPLDFDATPEIRMKQFQKAMHMVGAELTEGLLFLGKIWWPSQQEFKQFVLKRTEVDASGQIVLINLKHLIGWKSALIEIEEELGIVNELKYIIFHDPKASESPWRITAVPVNLKSFQCRVPLKSAWCGLRGEELQAISKIDDAAFVHNSGFTGGAKSMDGVLRLARESLNL